MSPRIRHRAAIKYSSAPTSGFNRHRCSDRGLLRTITLSQGTPITGSTELLYYQYVTTSPDGARIRCQLSETPRCAERTYCTQIEIIQILVILSPLSQSRLASESRATRDIYSVIWDRSTLTQNSLPQLIITVLSPGLFVWLQSLSRGYSLNSRGRFNLANGWGHFTHPRGRPNVVLDIPNQ